jgi:hypothetical protein
MSWKLTLTPGVALDEPAIRELWSFRLSIMRLKPHVSPEKDFEKFASHCRQGQRILRLRNESGQLCGSVVPRVYEGTFQTERFRLVVPEYFYLTPELRGSAAVPWAWARCLAPLVYSRGVRVFLGGIGYPTGALTLDRFLGPVWLYGEPQAPPLASSVLEWIVTHLAGSSWDAARCQVDMGTLPPTPTTAWLARSQRREFYRRYVERCPQWQEGRTVPCVTEYSSWKLAQAALRVPRRWWKRHLG